MRREQRIKHALRMVPASDRFVYCAPGAVASVDMRGVARLIDVPELAEDRFQTAQGRMENWEEYLALFVPPFARKTAQEWFEEAEALDLTFALVQTVDDLFDCPQLARARVLPRGPGARREAGFDPRQAVQDRGWPGGSIEAAPAFPGEHTAEVLRDWAVRG